MSSSTASKSPLTDAEIRELIKRAQQGDLESRETVIVTHLPLAKSFALKYKGYGVPLDDLYQEACYGLCVALNHYNTQQNATFATFSRFYMKKYICENALLKQNSNLPSCYDRDFYYEIKKYIHTFDRLKQETGHDPTDTEMASSLNISLWRIKRIKQAANAFMAPSADVEEIGNVHHLDPSSRPLEDEYISRLGLSTLKGTLTAREIEVLERRCGYTESGTPETWPQISAQMGLSIETLRRTYRFAISKIQNTIGITDQP